MSAYDDFLERVNEVKSLMSHVAPEVAFSSSGGSDAGIPILKERRRPFTDSTLARSCTVLIVSYFEGFLKDLADDAFDALLEASVPSSKANEYFRGYLISAELDSIRTGRGVDKDWNAFSKIVDLTSEIKRGGRLEERLIPREQTKRAVTSIDPKKIRLLFEVFGETDFKTGPLSRHSGDLNSIRNTRNNCVHGNEGDLTPMSLGDAIACADSLTICANDLTVRLDQLVANLTMPNSPEFSV